MSTNLEKKSFEIDVRKLNDRMERSIDVVEQKFNDALIRIDNMKKSIENCINESNYTTLAPELLNKIDSRNTFNNQLKDHFINSNISVDDIVVLSQKYSDNEFKLANIATNDLISGDPSFVDDDTTIHGDEYTISSKVSNSSFLSLTGVNAFNNGDPTFAKGFISSLGHSRSIYMNMFDSINISFADDLNNQQPFVKEYNPIRSLDFKPNQSVPFIVIERINKVNSFDFGIQYVTKANTVKCYIKDGNGVTVLESATHTNSSSFTRRYYGSIILEDCGDEIKSSYILKNGDKSIFDNDNPEFIFRLSFDDNYIFIYLENIKPCRYIYSEIENPEIKDFYNPDNSLSQIFIRDIYELLVNEDKDTINEDDILAIKNKFGVGKELFGENVGEITKDILAILTPFRNDLQSIQNIFVIPNYMINLSLKDNSLHIKDTFIVGQMYGRNDILELPYSLLKIVPKSNSLIQLENIPLTEGNNIQIVNPIKNVSFTNTNVEYSVNKDSFVKRCNISNLIKENVDFIKDHIIDNNPVFYTSRALITTMLNDNNMVDSNKIPDYVIDEIGKYVRSGDLDLFYCVYYITHTLTNETISISNDKELYDFISKTPLKFKYFSSIENDIPVNEESSIPLALQGNNFGGNAYKNIFPVLFNSMFGLNLNESFKGLIRIKTDILQDMYDHENIVINHLSLTDDTFKFGIAPKKYENSDSLPNQAIILKTDLIYKNITVVGYENCVVTPMDITAVVGSNVTYTIKPFFLYKIDRILVNDEEVSLVDDKLNIRNITEDVVITIESSERDLNRTISIISNEHCLSINPSGSIIVQEGESITFSVTPEEGYRLTSVNANGEPIYVKDNSFTLKNVMINTDLEIVCTEIPKIEYFFELDSSDNCILSPLSDRYIVYEGDSFEVIITPNIDYEITKYSINGALFTISGDIIDVGPDFPETEITINGNIVTFNNIKETINFKADVEKIPTPIYHILTYGENCLIEPTTSNELGYPLEENESKTFTVEPLLGYILDTIRINGEIVTESNQIEGVIIENDGLSITFNSVQSDAFLEVICVVVPPIKYLISIDIPEGSLFTILNSEGTTDDLEYEINSTPIFTIVPNEGYRVTHVAINDVQIEVDSNVYQFQPLTEVKTISAIVETIPINEYDINIERFNNCTIDISPSTHLIAGDYALITIEPDEGYELEVVRINGILQNPVSNVIEIDSIDKNYNIIISCKPTYIMIEPIDGENYSIIPNSTTPVKYGDYQLFEIIPNEGYKVESIIVSTDGIDEDPIPLNRFYLFLNVTEPHTIRATVIKKSHSVIPLSGEGYSVDPSLSEIIFYDEDSSEFSFIPDTGKYIYQIFVNNEEVYINNTDMFEPASGADLSYLTIKHTIENVKNNKQIYAITKDLIERAYTITTVYDETKCIISPASFITVSKGSSAAISIITIEGFKISHIYINGEERELYGNDVDFYETFVDISNDILITVVSEVRPPTIFNVTQGPNSNCVMSCLNPDMLLNPTGSNANPVRVVEGNSLTFKAVPINYLYRIVKFIINSLQEYLTDGGYGEKQYTIPSVDDNMSIIAISELIKHKITLVEALNCIVANFDGNGSYVLVNHNTNYTLLFNPSADHELETLTINGQSVTSIGNTYIITNILEDKNIVVRYIPKLYVTLHDGVNCKYNVYLSGTVLELNTTNGMWRMSRGTNYFKITTIPDVGYEVKRSWISSPDVISPNPSIEEIKYQEVTTSINEIIFNNIQTNVGWYSECSKIQYNISVIQPQNGEITLNDVLISNVTVEYGDDVIFTITPNNGCKIAILRINGSITPFPVTLTEAGGTYTFENITANKSITVTIESI